MRCISDATASRGFFTMCLSLPIFSTFVNDISLLLGLVILSGSRRVEALFILLLLFIFLVHFDFPLVKSFKIL